MNDYLLAAGLNSPLIQEAQTFGRAAHDSINQKRKYTGEPYWVHTEAVADTVARVGGTTQMIIAALLHDVLEDVYPIHPEYNADKIRDLFGIEVLQMVLELTDVFTKENHPELNRENRKKLERERLGMTLVASKTIKLADLINNTKSIVADDPDFARVYLKEKMAMLGELADGNAELLQEASELALKGYQTLNIPMHILTP